MTSPVTPYYRKQAPAPAPTAPPLPQNPEAERSVLGAILLDNHKLDVALDKLKSGDFFQHNHQRIFAHMIELTELHHAIDLVTLSEKLNRAGELESIGGAAYLSQLVDGVPRITNVDHYARIVKEKSVLRKIIHTTAAIQQQAMEAREDADVILDGLANAVAGLSESRVKKSDLRSYTADEILAVTSMQPEYVAYGIAPRGTMTGIDGDAKGAGKTTLNLSAIAAQQRGGLFLNRATMPGPVVYVSEEGPNTLGIEIRRHGLAGLPDVHFVYANPRSWTEKVLWIEQECERLKAVWLVIDTFFTVALLGPDAENDAGAVVKALAPLRAITTRLNLATTLDRHRRKSGGVVGASGRGSIAFTGEMDQVLELKRLPGDGNPRIRTLEIIGRIEEQKRLHIELLEDGRYTIAANEDESVFERAGDMFASKSTVRDVASELKITPARAGRFRQKWLKLNSCLGETEDEQLSD